MARIPVVPAREAGPLTRLAYTMARRQLGRDVEPVGVFAHAPRLLIGWGALERTTASQHTVDTRLKALAELRAAALVSCEFCCDIGSAVAREGGVGEEQLLALPHYGDSPHFSELERLVLDYATAMSRTPTSVSDELFARLREHFSERQMVELTNVIALENMRARFNSAFDMTPAGFSEGMVCVIPEAAPDRASAAAPTQLPLQAQGATTLADS